MLRESEARDRAAFIELFASPEVRTYLGGPRPRDELERAVPEVPGRRPGLFVIDLNGAMIGRLAQPPSDLPEEAAEHIKSCLALQLPQVDVEVDFIVGIGDRVNLQHLLDALGIQEDAARALTDGLRGQITELQARLREAETHLEHLAITRKTVTGLADRLLAAPPDLPEHPDYPASSLSSTRSPSR
ncbi:hypothetical protein GCM10010255_62180 [Streptomyces coeruleofuscus]|uniref:Uncharacterized protein n=1 Tax=Streptomyces coeruleofuscus TaxID=66879 RepID=A0ABN3IWR1_9ACTN